jgi:hypothetical protein
MQIALYVILPTVTMVLLLAAAIVYGDGAGVAGAHAAWTGPAFPPMCGP